MKKSIEKYICMIPVALWFVVIPLIVKVKFYENPLTDYPWYSSASTLGDFFLYYKSLLVTVTGILMLGLIFWQIAIIRKKDVFCNP